MPRKARIDAPGALHHIICRGIERRKIFLNDIDRDDFVDRLSMIVSESETLCYAWALIPNHFHLLLKTGNTPIATVMRRLLTGYAVGFNHRHRRYGRLFQNRYKSILCQADPYLLELVRYIHLNPLRAGIGDGAGTGQAKYLEFNWKSMKKRPFMGLYRDFQGQKTNYRRIVLPSVQMPLRWVWRSDPLRISHGHTDEHGQISSNRGRSSFFTYSIFCD